MVDKIESATLRGAYALGVFLDIAGAFDSLAPEAANAGLRDKEVDQHIVEWYMQYMGNRVIQVNINGVIRGRLEQRARLRGES